MLSTLILLYALDTGQIPVGCYVAAWVFTIIKGICLVIKCLVDLSDFCGAKIRAACEEINFILKIKEEKSLWN